MDTPAQIYNALGNDTRLRLLKIIGQQHVPKVPVAAGQFVPHDDHMSVRQKVV